MIFSVLAAAAIAASPANRLPSDAVDALHAAKSGVLYSLEPWSSAASTSRRELHGYELLGKVELTGEAYRAAAQEFEAAVERSGYGVAACFDPRHALKVEFGSHEYELLLCYACHQIAVYRDGKHVATLGAAGSAKSLNALLVAANVPISTSYDEDAELARARQSEIDAARWEAAMPPALAPLWSWDVMFPDGELTIRMRDALRKEFPGTTERVLALYHWYGSGAGPWSGFPAYETVAEELLLTHTTDELLGSLNARELTDTQTEGAARLFGGWSFNKQRPAELARLPAAWKARFLVQALKSDDDDKRGRAERAFRN